MECKRGRALIDNSFSFWRHKDINNLEDVVRAVRSVLKLDVPKQSSSLSLGQQSGQSASSCSSKQGKGQGILLPVASLLTQVVTVLT